MYKLTALLLLCSVTLFGMQMFEDDEYADELVGSDQLIGAKFVGEKIWQDQPINQNIKSMNYYQAKDYCENLDLLGIRKWTLPSTMDFEMLDTDMSELTYRTSRDGYFTFYFTRDEDCSIRSGECVKTVDMSTNRTPYFSTDRKSAFNAVRCVLNPNVYNDHQMSLKQAYEAQGGIDGYLSAFMATGDRVNIKKAIEIADSTSDKAKIEKALFSYLGALKVFEIRSNGEVISEDTHSSEADSFIFNSIQKSKNLKYKFSMSPKEKAALRVKYNTYKIEVRFNLKLTYQNVLKKAFMGMDFGNTQTKQIPIVTTFVLSKDNDYAVKKTLDFGTVNQGGSSSALLFKMNTSLQSAEISYDIVSVEIE